MKISLAAPAAFDAQGHAQRRALRHGHLKQPFLARRERGGVRNAQRQAVHGHGQQIGRRRGLARDRHARRQRKLVENIGANDDVVLPRSERRQSTVERAGVASTGLQRALVQDRAQVDVGNAPGRPRADVDRIRPAPRRRVGRALVRDHPAHREWVARFHRRRVGQRDAADDELARAAAGRSPGRGQEQAVVVLVRKTAFEHLADGAVGGRIGDHEEIVRTRSGPAAPGPGW